MPVRVSVPVSRSRNHPFIRMLGWIFLAAAGVGSLTAGGCKTTKPNAEIGRDKPPSGVEVPLATALLASHNQRVAGIDKFAARGVLELQWMDKNTRRFEQGDVDVWFHLPQRTAIRVEKLGEPLLWFGSNENAYWLFDLRKDVSEATIRPHEKPLEIQGPAVVSVRPLELLVLLGFARLNEADIVAVEHDVTGGVKAGGKAGYDKATDAWTVRLKRRTSGGNGNGDGSLRVYFDRGRGFIRRIDLLGASDELLVRSDLAIERYRPAPLANRPPGAFPWVATRVDIRDEVGGGQMKFALDGESLNNSQPQDRFFDPKWLEASLRPRTVNR